MCLFYIYIYIYMLSSKQYVILVITAMAGFVGTHALGHIRFIGRESLMTTFIYIYGIHH